MEQWNARMATLVVMVCAGLTFIAPLYACGQSGGAQAATKADNELSHSKTVEVDIKTLETRLKNTDAIGFFTKLAIRSNIIDLMNKIRQYRKQSMLKAKMKEIRASFDGLLLKIIALLEEDPKLSRDLYVSRESIWESLLEVKA